MKRLSGLLTLLLVFLLVAMPAVAIDFGSINIQELRLNVSETKLNIEEELTVSSYSENADILSGRSLYIDYPSYIVDTSLSMDNDTFTFTNGYHQEVLHDAVLI